MRRRPWGLCHKGEIPFGDRFRDAFTCRRVLQSAARDGIAPSHLKPKGTEKRCFSATPILAGGAGGIPAEERASEYCKSLVGAGLGSALVRTSDIVNDYAQGYPYNALIV
jgi:hypothetical protein